MSGDEIFRTRISRRIKSVYHQLSEIDMEHNDFGTPRRVKIIHNDLNDIIDALIQKGLSDSLPPKRQLDFEEDLSMGYQQVKSDILKIADLLGVDVLHDNIIRTPTQQINVNVLSSNVQDLQSITQTVNTINISELKKAEINQIFSKLEETAKNTTIEDSEKNSKLRQLLGELVKMGLDVGILGLRWVNENGLVNKIFGH